MFSFIKSVMTKINEVMTEIKSAASAAVVSVRKNVAVVVEAAKVAPSIYAIGCVSVGSVLTAIVADSKPKTVIGKFFRGLSLVAIFVGTMYMVICLPMLVVYKVVLELFVALIGLLALATTALPTGIITGIVLVAMFVFAAVEAFLVAMTGIHMASLFRTYIRTMSCANIEEQSNLAVRSFFASIARIPEWIQSCLTSAAAMVGRFKERLIEAAIDAVVDFSIRAGGVVMRRYFAKQIVSNV